MQKKWKSTEIEKLCNLKTSQRSWNEIAIDLGRSIDSCKKKYHSLSEDEKDIVLDYKTREWSNSELQHLYEMRQAGVPYRIIASDLRRSHDACKGKYNKVDWNKFQFSRESEVGKSAKERLKKDFKERVLGTVERKMYKYQMAADIVADSLAKALVPYNKIEPPKFTKKKRKRTDEDVILILSDVHIGAHHTLDETGGLGEFNHEILKKRLKNLMYGVADIHDLHSQLYQLPRLHIACLGDIVAGSNDAGEWSQNFINMTITEQVAEGYKLISDMINYWLNIFPEIIFYGVRGNHGRVANRGIEKDYVNWDIVCYDFLKVMFKDNPRIKFHVPKTWWLMPEIRNHKFLMVHGDDLKSKGFPVRGLLDFEQKMTGILKEIPDYTLAGHFHNSAELTTNNGKVIINGSVIGGDVYSIKTVHANSRPEQTIFGVHDRHGMTWKYNINLDYDKDEKGR